MVVTSKTDGCHGTLGRIKRGEGERARGSERGRDGHEGRARKRHYVVGGGEGEWGICKLNDDSGFFGPLCIGQCHILVLMDAQCPGEGS